MGISIPIMDYYAPAASTRKPDIHVQFENFARKAALRNVMPFKSRTDRDTQFLNIALLGLGAPPIGALSFLEDEAVYERYTGSAWIPLPGQLLKRHRRTSASPSSAGSVVGVIRLDNIPVVPGYAYRIVCPSLSLTSAAGDNAQITMRVNTGGVATTGSTAIATDDRVIPSSSVFDAIDLEGEYIASGSDALLSVILCIQRISGSGSLSMNGSATKPIDMKAYFDGKDPGPTGVDL